MQPKLLAQAPEDGADHGPGLWSRTFRLTDGSESPPVVTNIRVAGNGRKAGSGMINVATGLLFALAIGLFAVSLNAQYTYVFHVKHQSIVSMIEAISLDAGMAIFSLLALGLARAGKAARVERVLILVCALGSAGMNYAAANVLSPRSVAAYVVPPVFLALVVDRVVAVVRRHVLGDDECSPWSAFGRVALYGLRFVLAPPSTAMGMRRAVLNATPVPADPATAEDSAGKLAPQPMIMLMSQRGPVQAITGAHRAEARSPKLVSKTRRPAPRSKATGATSKSQAFLELVVRERGPLAEIPLADVHQCSKTYAPRVGLHVGSARTVLRKAVIAAGGAK